MRPLTTAASSRTAPAAGPSGRPTTLPHHPGRRGGAVPGRARTKTLATPGDGDGEQAPQPRPPPPRRRRPRRALDPVEQATFAEWARGVVSGGSDGRNAGDGAGPQVAPTTANGGWGRAPPSPASALESGAYEGTPGSPEATLQNVLAVSLALLLGAALAGMAVRVVAVAAALAAAALRYTVVAVLLLFFALFFTP